MSTMFKTDLSRYAFARPSELIPTRLGQETCLANLADRKRAPTRTLPAGLRQSKIVLIALFVLLPKVGKFLVELRVLLERDRAWKMLPLQASQDRITLTTPLLSSLKQTVSC